MDIHSYALLCLLAFHAYFDAMTEHIYPVWTDLALVGEAVYIIISNGMTAEALPLLIMIAAVLCIAMAIKAFMPSDMLLLILLVMYSFSEGQNVSAFFMTLFITMGMSFALTVLVKNIYRCIVRKGSKWSGALVPHILIGYMFAWIMQPYLEQITRTPVISSIL